jgi:hypothetical protein
MLVETALSHENYSTFCLTYSSSEQLSGFSSRFPSERKFKRSMSFTVGYGNPPKTDMYTCVSYFTLQCLISKMCRLNTVLYFREIKSWEVDMSRTCRGYEQTYPTFLLKNLKGRNKFWKIHATFLLKNFKGRDYLDDLGIDERVWKCWLNSTSSEWCAVVGCCENYLWNFRFHGNNFLTSCMNEDDSL